MLLTLVAHAPTPAARRAAFPGAEDPLEPGFAPAHLACDRSFRGPERRCAETATALGLEAAVDEELRDLGAGAWAGRGLTGLPPADVAAWTTHPSFAPPGGEPVAALAVRVAAWLDTVPDPAARAAEHVVAVTHPAVLRAAVLAAVGAPAQGFWHVEAPPSSHAVLSHDGRRWTLRGLGLSSSRRAAPAGAGGSPATGAGS